MTVIPFKPDGVVAFCVVTWHALDELDERIQFCRVDGDVCLGSIRTGDGLPPVWIVALDLFADEPPPTTADLDVGVVCPELPFTVVVELLPAEELVTRDDDGVFERQRE